MGHYGLVRWTGPVLSCVRHRYKNSPYEWFPRGYARSESGSTVAIEVDEVRCRAESITGAPRCFDAPLAMRTRWGISS